MRRRSWLTLLTAAARPGDALRAVTRPQSQRVRPSGLALRGGAALMGLGPLATSAAVIGAGNGEPIPAPTTEPIPLPQ